MKSVVGGRASAELGRARAGRDRKLPAPDPSVGPIGVVGLGYMGLATALSLGARGHRVVGFDVSDPLRRSLERGASPIREPQLQQLLRRLRRTGRFSVADDLDGLVRSSRGVFLCLPTPARRSGRIDLRPLTRGVKAIAVPLRRADGCRALVIKSTVVPGTTETVIEPLVRSSTGRPPASLGVAANPEFLAEGSMLRDAIHPERIVVGTRPGPGRTWLRGVYRPFGAPVFELSPTGAELVKYASNAFLALKVSYANELSRMAERLGVHVDRVLEAVGADPRIGPRFLRAGPGFGGSCFDKDLRAIVTSARELGVRFRLGEATLRVNQEQTEHALRLIGEAAGPLRDRQVAVLGLSFKPGTDDVRESRAFPLVDGLVNRGARPRVHDPAALGRFREAWEGGAGARGPRSAPIEYRRSVAAALDGADVAVLQTDWPVYHGWTKAWTRRMARGLLVDLRRALPPSAARRANLKVVALGVGLGANGGAARRGVPLAGPVGGVA